MNVPTFLPSPNLAHQAQVPLPSGATGLILFVIYVIFGPGNVLFQIAALVRLFVLRKTTVDPKAMIQWPTDPKHIRRYLLIGVLVTLAPLGLALLSR